MTIPNLRSCVLGRDEKHIGGSIRTFVCNDTDDGVVGTGECNSANGDCSGSATREAVLVPRPHWIGQDPTTTRRFMKTLHAEDVTAEPIRLRRYLH